MIIERLGFKKKLNPGAVITEPGSSIKNKTGSWRSLMPVRKSDSKCTKCGLCWMFCPDNAINEKLEFDYNYCKGCGICAEVCPLKNIFMKKEEK